MKIMHYTVGYGGNLNYHTTCGKEIHSHSETEDATIDPEEVTCPLCRENKAWEEDLGYKTGKLKEETRRIYIESDILSESELRGAKMDVYHLCKKAGKKCIRRVFSDVLDYAWHDLEKTWQAVKKADEIYSDSSLMPLMGGSYMGAPVIFNGMCERAVKEGIQGKSVFILNKMKDIYWEMIDIPLMKKAFKKNSLYMYDEEYNIQKVDVSKINKKRYQP